MRKSLAIALVVFAVAAAAAASPDRSITASGTITKLQAAERTIRVTLADGTEAVFTWTADTKINGVLAPGAKVTIRYETGADGRNRAQQISVSKS
jgi:hypothetical protein